MGDQNTSPRIHSYLPYSPYTWEARLSPDTVGLVLPLGDTKAENQPHSPWQLRPLGASL